MGTVNPLNMDSEPIEEQPRDSQELTDFQQVQLMVRDACTHSTNAYYAVAVLVEGVERLRDTVESDAESDAAQQKVTITEEHMGDDSEEHTGNDSEILKRRGTITYEYRSVWASDRIHVNIWLSQPWVQQTLFGVTLVLLVNALIEEPVDNRLELWGWEIKSIPMAVTNTIFFVCHSILLSLFAASLWGIWPTRHHWCAVEARDSPQAKATQGLAQPVRCIPGFWHVSAHFWICTGHNFGQAHVQLNSGGFLDSASLSLAPS